LANDLILQFGYFGIFFVLVLGGLGLPVPEEAPIILAGILSRKGTMHWIPALASCFAGVLVGDFVVYFLGFFYGEKVLSLPLTRKFLTRAREAQIKGYFHRHGVKILILGRFAVGFRTAAYLTAGILRLPTLKLFLTDLVAASISTFLMFGLSYAFASKVEEGFQEAKHYITPVLGLLLVSYLLHRYVKARLRAGLLVGPPVLVSDDAPLPPDDLHSTHETSREAPQRPAMDLSELIPDGRMTIPPVELPLPSEESHVAEPVELPIVPEIPAVAEPSLSHHPALAPERQP
jgi:membrane protein DedA with SNARE-associated domain